MQLGHPAELISEEQAFVFRIFTDDFSFDINRLGKSFHRADVVPDLPASWEQGEGLLAQRARAASGIAQGQQGLVRYQHSGFISGAADDPLDFFRDHHFRVLQELRADCLFPRVWARRVSLPTTH